jgi:hypothetical protein
MYRAVSNVVQFHTVKSTSFTRARRACDACDGFSKYSLVL